MYITMETDYAVRIMIFLADQQKRVGAQLISAQTHVSLRFALKILRKLTAAGFIDSYRGVGGGYELKQPPSDISLYDVVTLIEGNVLLSRCLTDSMDCNRDAKHRCHLHQTFARISKQLENELRAVTLDQLIEHDGCTEAH